MKFLALGLLFVGAAVATSIGGFGQIGTPEDLARISLEYEPFLNTNPNLPLLKSAPGIIQPEYHVGYDEGISHHDEYGLPHEEYGPPPVPHDEYGPPPAERIVPVVTTEHYCPEEDFKSEFLRVPPIAPEIIPLPEVPLPKYVEPIYVPEIPHEEYGVPEVPHEEYGPPPAPLPLCPNGAPDVAYPFCCVNGAVNPFCCENGASNEFCCLGEYVNPTCSAPPTEAPEVKLSPYPAKKLCGNYAEDFTYPYCCENGAANEWCCLGEYINPTCSAPVTEPPVPHEEYGPPPVPLPLCPNGAPDVSYPFCCLNGATNGFCCLGEFINPTCSEPVTEAPIVKLAPYPPKKLCDNGAQDFTYPYCCENGAANEFCCLGEYINPTCSAPVTEPPVPLPLCPNGAPDIAYPFCCENGATNPYCCVGEYINPTCSEPTTTTTTTTPAPTYAPYPAKKLCENYAEDFTYPYCCQNGATNEWCCLGEYINPTCSAPTTTTTTTLPPPPPPTVRYAPYPAPTTTTTTTTTTPVPIVAKSPYAARVESHYDAGRATVQASASIGSGKPAGIIQVTAESTKGVIPHHSVLEQTRIFGNGPIVGVQAGVGVKAISGVEAGAHARVVNHSGRSIAATPVHTFRIVKPVITFKKRFVRNPIKKILKLFG